MALPTGTVTFVFTDIEGSTALLERLGNAYGDVLFGHHRLLREIWNEHDGAEVSTEGDAFFVAFGSASAAVKASGAAQAALAANPPAGDKQLRVRIGVHTGEPRMRDGDYWGPDVHYAARVASAAHGGQVLVSAATAALVGSGVELTPLGQHRLKDFPEPRELFALGPGPHPAPRSLDPLRSNLPSPPTRLIARGAEVDELVDLLVGDDRLVTITGAGGIGKTRVALAVADRLVDELADGAFLVELAEVTSHGAVGGAIASVFGAGGDANGLAATLSGREALVVLDNFEHILDAAPIVAGLLAGAPRLRILITSQAPLRIAGERTYALAPLAVPGDDTVESLADAPAAELLMSRAQRFVVDDDNAAAVATLCRELDGSPLAIELAAARLTLLDPSELVQRLRRSPGALGRGGRDLPQRHRGLQAAMSWSYGLLDEQPAKLFRRLGHFAGEATLGRIEQVCGDDDDDVLESLAALVDLSLVRRTRDGRFELPSALRMFARGLLDDDEREAMRRRHAEALECELLLLVIEQPFTCDPPVREAVAAERSDVIALLEWAEVADPEQFARLMAFSSRPFNESGEIYRWRDAIKHVLATDATHGRVRTLTQVADMLTDERAAGGGWLALARRADTEGDPRFGGWLLGTGAGVDINGGLTADDPEWQEVLAAVAELHDSDILELQQMAADLEGHLLMAQGRWDEAVEAFEATLARGGVTWVAESASAYLGDCHLQAGRPNEALRGYGRGARFAVERNEIVNTAFQAEGIVAALVDLGRPGDALEALGASDTLTAEGLHPRDTHQAWSRLIIPRIDQAREALGHEAAEAAYARGARMSVDAAVKLLLTISDPVTSRSASEAR